MDSRGRGLWSEVVRRGDAQNPVLSIEGDVNKLAISGAGFESEAGSKDTGAAANLDPGTTPSVSVNWNGERESSPDTVVADSPSEASPKLVRSPWKKPIRQLKDSPEGAVVGPESWPSLADSHTTKHSSSPRSALTQDSSQFNPFSDQENLASSVRQTRDDRLLLGQPITESRKQSDSASRRLSFSDPPKTVSELGGNLHPPLRESVPLAKAINHALGSNALRGRARNQRGSFMDNAWEPERNRSSGFPGRNATPYHQRADNAISPNPGRMYNQNGANGFYPRHVRAPRLRGNNSPHMDAAKIYHNQGRGATHWHSQQLSNHIPPFQQPFFDPRSLVWGVPTGFHPHFGFFDQPVPKDMFYPPMGTPGFPQGAGFYAHSGALHFLPPVVPNASLEYFLTKQIEYYFSNENLVKDVFLRSKMDAEGFVPASLIASFNKIKMLNADAKMILNCLQNSSVVEVQGENLRKRNDWPLWLLPPNQHNLPLNADSCSEASDNHSICSSRNNELTGMDGASFDPDIDPEPYFRQSKSSFQDTTGTLVPTPPSAK